MTIDWSKAPEGAQRYAQGCTNPWLKKTEDGIYFFNCHDRWTRYMTKKDGEQHWADAMPRQWRGPQDGLPPVGTEVEAQHFTGWVRGVVVAHVTADEKRAVVQCENAWFARGLWSIRPVPTERERAIEEMIAVWKPTMGRFAEEKQGLAEMLYDAGYRKGEHDLKGLR